MKLHTCVYLKKPNVSTWLTDAYFICCMFNLFRVALDFNYYFKNSYSDFHFMMLHLYNALGKLWDLDCTLILVFYYQSGWLCLYAWRSPAALSILWNSEQSDYFDWQVWATKRICICWICWNWCCSECSPVKWVWVAWSSIEGLSVFFYAIDYFMNLLFWS